MLAGSAYMGRHNQVAGIVYRNVCNQYGIEVPKSQWAIPIPSRGVCGRV